MDPMRLLLWGVAALAVTWLALVAWAVVGEKGFVYHPGKYGDTPVGEPPAALQARTVRFTAADGTRLSGWVIPSAADAPDLGLWVLVAHGNDGHLGEADRPAWYAALRALGVHLLAFDYRGYGASDRVPPHEAGLYADGMAAYRHLRDVEGVPGERIVLYGHSLGSGVAVELATQVEAAGLVLEGAFTSSPKAGQHHFPVVPMARLGRERFANDEKMSRVSMPLLVLHGTEDRVVPLAMGQALVDAARPPKQLVTLRAGHHDALARDGAVYLGAWRGFLQGLAAEGPLGESAPAR